MSSPSSQAVPESARKLESLILQRLMREGQAQVDGEPEQCQAELFEGVA